ncbi:hypothetical protein niasHS_016868 [Heterodera schachtii]|uniref:Hexosyltransferase n=1 Tax=Heterodera schachtii TaxID=97005 RepID=A0ABD2HQH0_HETSC
MGPFAGGQTKKKCGIFRLPTIRLRSPLPLVIAFGFLIGFLIPYYTLLFDAGGFGIAWEGAVPLAGDNDAGDGIGGTDVQNAEHWERRIIGSGDTIGTDQQQQQQSIKLIRARFAAAELGIRRRLLLLPLVRSPVGISLHRWVLSPHFDTPTASVRAVVDTALVDPANFGDAVDTIQLRPGAHVPTHVQLLNAIANQTLQHSFDWFFLFSERTFVNPFRLWHTIDHLRWNVPLAFGHNRRAGGAGGGSADDDASADLCAVEGGILLSNSAMRLLVDGRNLCRSIVAPSASLSSSPDEFALAKCILLATNLSCHPSAQRVDHLWWHQMPTEDQQQQQQQQHTVPDKNNYPTLPLHDQIAHLATHWPNFNHSLTVSPLLSELDVRALLEHFVHVQIGQLDAEIEGIERQLEAEFDEAERGWPIGFVGTAGHQPVPNRFQAPVWQLFNADGTILFGNDPDRNVEHADQALRDELALIIELAKQKAEEASGGGAVGDLLISGGHFKAGRVRQGYRRFDPEKGMEYMVDLEEKQEEEEGEKHRQRRLVRVQLARPFHSTTVLDKVPFVKEDSDITIVVPVESVDQALSVRALLRRQLLLCTASSPAAAARLGSSTHRQIRFIITARSIEAALVRILGANLAEMERKCKHSFNTDSALLLLQPATNADNKMPIEIVAIDTAIDRYGQETLFLLLSPFADFQRDFLDRVRVNTIRHFQVFFPVPFAEFNPFVSGLSQPASASSPADIGDFVIHKDRGRFDTDEFGVAAIHGTDYATIRARFTSMAPMPPNGASPAFVGLFQMFHNTTGQHHHHLHLMRPIDPSLRIRYHPRGVCPAAERKNAEDDDDGGGCARARAERMGTRAQLARLIFANN